MDDIIIGVDLAKRIFQFSFEQAEVLKDRIVPPPLTLGTPNWEP